MSAEAGASSLLGRGYGPLASAVYQRAVVANAGRYYEAAALALTEGHGSGAAPARILDVGCGSGEVARALLRHLPEAEVLGIDLSESQLRRARRLSVGETRLRFELRGAGRTGLNRGAFDLVYSIASVKHWPDPIAGLRELGRLVAPGGRLEVAEIDRGAPWSSLQRFAAGVYPLPAALGAPAMRYFVAGNSFDREDAASLAAKAGLEGAKIEEAASEPFWHLRWRSPA